MLLYWSEEDIAYISDKILACICILLAQILGWHVTPAETIGATMSHLNYAHTIGALM